MDAVGGGQFVFQRVGPRRGQQVLAVFLDQLGQHPVLRQHPPRHRNLRPMVAAHVGAADDDDEDHHADLDDDQQGIGPCAFANPQDEDGGDHGHDQQRGEIEPRMPLKPFHRREGIGEELEGDLQPGAEHEEELVEVAGPGRGDRGAAHGVFEDQVPADDPGEDFAQRGVGVGIGAAGHGGHGGEFGVAERGEGAAHGGDAEGDHDRRPGVLGCRPAGHDEDAGPDDAAHAQRGQGHRAQDAVQAVFAGRLGQQHLQVFTGKKLSLPVHGRFLVGPRRQQRKDES